MKVLANMKTELGYYADMLRWTQTREVIKATPKRKLSMRAHKIIRKAFKRRGGDYVSNNGHYFELVLAPRQLSPQHKIAVAFHELDGQLFKETRT